jgi:hypothetical protein
MARVLLKKDKLALIPKRCSEDNARALMATQEMRETLPKIRLVANMPVIVPAQGNTVEILNPGYHEKHQVLVTGKDIVEEIPYEQAKEPLLDLLRDFDFVTPGDKARAIAEMITPALRMGGHLEGPAPIHAAEADASQSGKTLRQEVTREMYGETGYLITQRAGGVGSVDESTSAGLLSAVPFMVYDNVRGKVDSKFLEASMTWNGVVRVRVPHMAEMPVDVSRTTFQLSSNGIEATKDLANRMSIARVRRRPSGHPFTRGRAELVALARKDRCKYLGCIFAIIKQWAAAGRPAEKNVTHHFQEWAGPLAWIVKNCFGIDSLMEAHVEAQGRVSDPALSWLRNVCIAVARSKLLDQELSASHMAELCADDGIEIPDLPSTADDDRVAKHIGRLLSRCFNPVRPLLEISIDGCRVTKVETKDEAFRLRRRYWFSREGNPPHLGTPAYPRIAITSREKPPFPNPYTDAGDCGVRGNSPELPNPDSLLGPDGELF